MLIKKDFTFTETPSTLTISIPFPGISAANSDIYLNSIFLKVNYPPNLFTLDLLYPVHTSDDLVKVSVGNNFVVVHLTKVVEQIWADPKFKSTSHAELLLRRKKAEQLYLDELESKRVERRKEKQENERLLVQKQINVEREERKRIEELKMAERKEAEDGLKNWVSNMNDDQNCFLHEEDILEEIDDVEDYIVTPNFKEANSDWKKPNISTISKFSKPIIDIKEKTSTQIKLEESTAEDKKNCIFTDADDIEKMESSLATENQHLNKSKKINIDFNEEIEDDDLDMEEVMAKVRKQMGKNGKKEVCPPRETSEITFSFSNRGFKPTTVARESEDVKWEARIKEARDAASKSNTPAIEVNKEDEGDVKFEETNIMLLKDKAKEMVKQENFEAAINVYTKIIELDNKDQTAYINRSGLSLRCGKHQQCISDCDNALSLLNSLDNTHLEEEERSSLKINRVRVLLRRGSSRWYLERFKDGVDDYREACKLVPDDLNVKEDLKRMEELLISF